MPPFTKQKAPGIPRIPEVTRGLSYKAPDRFMAAEWSSLHLTKPFTHPVAHEHKHKHTHTLFFTNEIQVLTINVYRYTHTYMEMRWRDWR